MNIGAVPGPHARGDGEGLKPLATGADTRLLEAATQFEAVFVQQMLTAMRSTVPEGGVVSGGHGEDIFASLLDGHLSELAASRIGRGLAETIYRQLTRGTGR